MKCADGYYVISDPETLIEICIPCQVHGCVSCNADGTGCYKCADGYTLEDGRCMGDDTPITPVIPTSSSGNVPTQIQPTNSTESTNGGDSSGNSSSKSKSKKAGLIAGVVIAVVAVVAALIVVVILLLRKRRDRPMAIRTDDVSGEMQQETNADSFKASSPDFNSTDNPIFAANTSESQVIEDPFINDFEEGRM